MDKELFIIEMLSAQSLVVASDRENKRKTFFVLLAGLLATISLFWGISTLVYFDLSQRTQNWVYSIRLEHLYYFSLGLGAVIGIILLFFMIINLRDTWQLKKHFSHWLEEQADTIVAYPLLYYGLDYFYLAKDEGPNQRIKIKKKPKQKIPVTIGDYEVYLGKREGIAGTSYSQLFILPTETLPVYDEHNLKDNRDWKFFGGLSIVAGVILIGMIYYGLRHDTVSIPETTANTDYPTEFTTSSSMSEAVETGGLISQVGNPPTTTGGELFQLDISQSDELYQTTDGGTSWQFVPIRVDWLRAGHYTTTDGEPPLGYWLDKTFQVGADFSWYVYSPDNLNLYFLHSMDNGQTWQTSVVSNLLAERLRYRKANFFNPGQAGAGRGYVAYSLEDPSVSAEDLFFFFTNDYGQTWQAGVSANFDRPIQNVSFLSSQIGFVSTRDDVYYTMDGGLNYDQAVISPPDGYAKGGLNIFDSPNEVVQINSTTYRAVFNFTKTGDFEGNQMDSWIYQSTDGGANWEVVEQGNQIRIN
ncbi:hypothetical protein [Enterococcus sp. LJL90]